MNIRCKIFIIVVGCAGCIIVPGFASAQVTVLDGVLEAGDPMFHRPSTSFPPCNLSSSGTTVYYDVYSVYHSGGAVSIEIDGTVDRLVFASYLPGMFNPASGCDDIVGVGGCFTLPVAFDVPELFDAGDYDFVVTSCYNGDTGSYTFRLVPAVFLDGFETGDTGEWTATSP